MIKNMEYEGYYDLHGRFAQSFGVESGDYTLMNGSKLGELLDGANFYIFLTDTT